MNHRVLDCAGKLLPLDRTRVMGILNITPDSFSDGGLWTDRDTAVQHALAMAAAGADMIDIGGESTRPGSLAVSTTEETERVIPLIEMLATELDIPISIDSSKPELMKSAVQAGAGMINDVHALREPGAVEAAAELGVPVCLMHMQGKPGGMQQSPDYQDVVAEVQSFLLARAAVCSEAGIAKEQIVLDPGFGFGKTLEHNLSLFRALPQLAALDFPVLAGLSRKSMLGQLTGRPVDQRLASSVTAAVLAARAGVLIVRVHDVAETVDALRIAATLH